jgi:hypothetical protein
LIDALANIAIIGPAINIRISKQDPMSYIPKYKITKDKLMQQFISANIASTTIDEYPSWLRKRAESLARTANEFLEELRGDVELPMDLTEDKNPEHAFEAA